MEATAVEALAQAMGLHRAALVRTWRDTASATAKRPVGAMPWAMAAAAAAAAAAAVVVVLLLLFLACQVERAMRIIRRKVHQ